MNELSRAVVVVLSTVTLGCQENPAHVRSDGVLASFESKHEIHPDEGSAPIRQSNEHATEGRHSLEVTLDREEAGFGFPLNPPVDFRGHSKVLVDVYNTGAPTSLISRVFDSKENVYVVWYYKLDPGPNVVELDVAGMGHNVDLSSVRRLYFYVEQPAGKLYVDNVRLSKEPLDWASRVERPTSHPSKDPPGNLLANGDFELGLSEWESWGEWDDGQYDFGSGFGENAISGMASVQITCRRVGRGGIFNDPMFLPAGNYVLRFWAKGTGDKPVMRWIFAGDDASRAAVAANLESPPIELTDQWREFRYQIMLRANAALRIYFFSIGGGTVYIDAASLVIPGADPIIAPARKDAVGPRRVTTHGDRILVDNKPFFPIGIYLAKPEALAGTGFNCTMPGRIDQDVLEECQKRNILVSPDLTGVMRAHLPWQAPVAIEQFKNHPAVFGWYLCDEPDHAAWTVPPPEMRLAAAEIKKVDPLHPTWAVVMCWADSNIYQYADTVDILATDVYPIDEGSRRPLKEIAEKTDVLRKAVEGKKPVFVVTQASKLVSPTEETALTYLAVTHGANGIFYWQFHDAMESPELWQHLVGLSHELKGLSPVLTAEGDPTPIASPDPRIHVLSRPLGDRLYVLAVNEGPEPIANVEFFDARVQDEPAKVLFEKRDVRVAGAKWRDNFAGYARHVYSLPMR